MISVTDIDYILSDIEDRVSPAPQTKTIPFNKWLLASAVQKCIRRGDAELAVQCAANLYHIDKRMLWRRLPIIALEDVSLGGGGKAMTETLAASASSKWRRKVGDLNAALYVTHRMAKSVKSRACTDLYFLSDITPTYSGARNKFPSLDDKELTDIVLNKDYPAAERALALWLISGTDRYPSDHIAQREGNLGLAMEIMAQLDAPFSVTQTCIVSLKRSRYPLALLTPLIFDLYSNLRSKTITISDMSTEALYGLPLFAMDGLYTRDGKTCVRLWRKQSSELMTYTAKQIATALFFVEGGLLDRELQNSALNKIKQLSKPSNLRLVGIGADRQSHLLQLVSHGLPKLNAIRKKHLTETRNDYYQGLIQ